MNKRNQLDEGTKQQVAADIEKHEAISDYLFDREDQTEMIHVGKAVGGAGYCRQKDLPCTGAKTPVHNLLREDREVEFTQMISRKIRYTLNRL